MSLGPRAPRVTVFDSGLGGLTVLSEIRKRQAGADIVYVADDAAFPYGDWSETALVDHVVELMGHLIADHRPDVVVIACNTASTLVLAPLRERYGVPFIGTVPAIKPAAEATKTGLISVLATPGTVARDYTRGLIDAFAGKAEVTLVGSVTLAAIAEHWLRGEPVDDEAIRQEIAPCFREATGARTDTIVLGCTHYPFLIDHFRRLGAWQVAWIDPAPAIARRLEALLDSGAFRRDGAPAEGRFLFTSGASVPPALRLRLAGFGLHG